MLRPGQSASDHREQLHSRVLRFVRPSGYFHLAAIRRIKVGQIQGSLAHQLVQARQNAMVSGMLG